MSDRTDKANPMVEICRKRSDAYALMGKEERKKACEEAIEGRAHGRGGKWIMSVLLHGEKLDIDLLRTGKGSGIFVTGDRKEALKWVDKAFSLGRSVAFAATTSGGGGGPGHPCE